MFKKLLSIFKKDKPHWVNDLIKCPSQCYCNFTYNGHDYCIYLRWRHDDPWTAEIVPLVYGYNFAYNGWVDLEPPFYTHDDYRKLQKWCIKMVRKSFKGLKFDKVTTIIDY